MKHFLYLAINIFTLSYPLFKSWDTRVSMYKKWNHLLPAIAAVTLFFLVFDYYFTKWGVWQFNPKYISGIYITNLPLEEVLFFITTFYACLFIYEVMNYFIKDNIWEKYAPYISTILVIANISIALIYSDLLYTFAHLFMAAITIIVHHIVLGNKVAGRFYISYLVCLIPFLLMNGILTATPVVIYNNSENLGLRIGTIPVEDTMYCLQMLLMNVTIYEYLNIKKESKMLNTKLV